MTTTEIDHQDILAHPVSQSFVVEYDPMATIFDVEVSITSFPAESLI